MRLPHDLTRRTRLMQSAPDAKRQRLAPVPLGFFDGHARGATAAEAQQDAAATTKDFLAGLRGDLEQVEVRKTEEEEQESEELHAQLALEQRCARP